jgi:hypothetical protein
MSNLEQHNFLFPATSEASISCAAFLFTAASGVSRCYGNDSQWTTGAADDFQRRGNDNRAGWRKLIKIAQAGQPKLAASVHQVVVRERRVEGSGLACIGPDGLYADT